MSFWRKTNYHRLLGIASAPKSHKSKRHYSRNHLVDRVGITWNLTSKREIVLWAIVIASPQDTPSFGTFHRLAPEYCDFAIFCNFCFINNFLLKSHNKIPLVSRQPLSLVVYDFAFESILPFLVKFSILSLNLVISSN